MKSPPSSCEVLLINERERERWGEGLSFFTCHEVNTPFMIINETLYLSSTASAWTTCRSCVHQWKKLSRGLFHIPETKKNENNVNYKNCNFLYQSQKKKYIKCIWICDEFINFLFCFFNVQNALSAVSEIVITWP